MSSRVTRGIYFSAMLLLSFTMLPTSYASVTSTSLPTGGNGEKLVFTVPDGWKEAYKEAKDNAAMIEYVPADQDVDNWTQLLTVQMFHFDHDIDPTVFLQKVNELSHDVCDNVTLVSKDSATANGYPTAVLLQSCGKYHETGKSEVTYFKAIAGTDNLYVVHRAWRGDPIAAGAKLPIGDDIVGNWRSYLDSVTLCDSQSTAHPCPADMGTATQIATPTDASSSTTTTTPVATPAPAAQQPATNKSDASDNGVKNLQ